MFVSIAVGTVILMTLVNGYFSYKRSESEIRTQITRIAESVTDSGFPVTDVTLQQVKKLSGTELILLDTQSKVAGSTIQNPERFVTQLNQLSDASEDPLQTKVSDDDETFYLTAAKKTTFTAYGQPAKLYVLFPERSYIREVRAAWLTPLITGLSGSLVVALLGVFASGQFTAKLRKLRDQVNIIAGGTFEPIAVPQRNDEFRDVSVSVNQMAERLKNYENQVRSQEREKTFNQIGRAIAHEIRNAVTGGRMAIELHRRKNSDSEDRHYLDVALQQLRQMESSVDRFLRIGDSSQVSKEDFDFLTTVDQSISLARPQADHLGVLLEVHVPDSEVLVHGSSRDLEQAVTNLLSNAIQAASGVVDGTNVAKPVVRITIREENDRVICEVADSGPGPGAEIKDRLFESFCTGKPDGIGLGLSLTRQIVQAHHGTIDWEREAGETRFVFDIPVTQSNQ